MVRFTILLVILCILQAISKGASRTTCGAVCAIYCEYGNVLDVNGCPTCSCRKSPYEQRTYCGNGQTSLQDYYCGRGPNHRSCPPTHKCIIAHNDAYAVCCPRQEGITSSTTSNIYPID